MIIYPAIDVLGGRCVRLTQGDFAQSKTYADDPVLMARRFAEAGLTHLHLVDLDGARAGQPQNLPLVQAISTETNLVIDLGGGIRTRADLSAAFVAGATRVTLGSVAASDPNAVLEWVSEFPDRLILGADVRDGRVQVSGWQTDSGVLLHDFVRPFYAHGLRRVICTDIGVDGTLQGPALSLYRDLLTAFPELLLTASGGVSSVDDLHRLRDLGVDGTIVGKGFYEGRLSLTDLVAYNTVETC